MCWARRTGANVRENAADVAGWAGKGKAGTTQHILLTQRSRKRQDVTGITSAAARAP
jgi:hypothetical protein